MAVGVTRNAQKALALMGPTAVQALELAGAVPSEYYSDQPCNSHKSELREAFSS